jgi:hypothetical protein
MSGPTALATQREYLRVPPLRIINDKSITSFFGPAALVA